MGNDPLRNKRVIVYPMHEEEWVLARNLLHEINVTDSFVFGEIEENLIQELSKRRVLVEVLEDRPEIFSLGRFHHPDLKARRKKVQRGMPKTIKQFIREFPFDYDAPNYYLIQFIGPLLTKWRNKLKYDIGIDILDFVPKDYYLVELTPRQFELVNSASFVTNVVPYEPDLKGPTTITTVSEKRLTETVLVFEIRLHRAKDIGQVQSWLNSHEVEVLKVLPPRTIRVVLRENGPLLYELRALIPVHSIMEYVPPTPHNGSAQKSIGFTQWAATSALSRISLSGLGEIIGIADTSIDTHHPDFPQLAGVKTFGFQLHGTDPDGHGTHVAGSIVGTGTASNGRIRGIAPGARLYFQTLWNDHNDPIGGLPDSLEDIFEDAFQNNVRIHNNSWGANTSGWYTTFDDAVDRFVARNKEMLIVISAGNDGTALDPPIGVGRRRISARGFVDLSSIGSPASAKNALTVGASRSRRRKGGWSRMRFGELDPANFADSPIADEKVSSRPSCLAAYSARGPSEGMRIKPDVVAPATSVVSTRSNDAPLRVFDGPYRGNRAYAYLGGTSMAAPLVSGCAALVREFYIRERMCLRPSAALIKATIVNGTKWLSGPDAIAINPLTPNYHQGFGCVYMPWTIPSRPIMLEFLDTWENPNGQFREVGDLVTASFEIGPNSPNGLRVCLVWTDSAIGTGLINRLLLIVEESSTKLKWVGNEDKPNAIQGGRPENNVQIVRIKRPRPGSYVIHIQTKAIQDSPQDFALVITGDLLNPIHAVMRASGVWYRLR